MRNKRDLFPLNKKHVLHNKLALFAEDVFSGVFASSVYARCKFASVAENSCTRLLCCQAHLSKGFKAKT